MFAHLNPHSSDFWYPCALYPPFLHRLTMQSSLFEPGRPVLLVVCVARKPRPCPSYSRRRDRINLVLWCSLYKGGGYFQCLQEGKAGGTARVHRTRGMLWTGCTGGVRALSHPMTGSACNTSGANQSEVKVHMPEAFGQQGSTCDAAIW